MKLIEVMKTQDVDTGEPLTFFRGYITSEYIHQESIEDSETCEKIGREFLSLCFHFHDLDF